VPWTALSPQRPALGQRPTEREPDLGIPLGGADLLDAGRDRGREEEGGGGDRGRLLFEDEDLEAQPRVVEARDVGGAVVGPDPRAGLDPDLEAVAETDPNEDLPERVLAGLAALFHRPAALDLDTAAAGHGCALGEVRAIRDDGVRLLAGRRGGHEAHQYRKNAGHPGFSHA